MKRDMEPAGDDDMMGQRLIDRIALVTGGGGEIGGAICDRFAAEGATVAVSDLVIAQAEAVAARIKAAGGRAIAIETDVAQSASAEEAVARIIEAFGALTTLVNVAATRSPDGTAETLPLEDWTHAFDVNLMSKFAIPEMRKAGGGAIVNIASQLGQMGVPDRMAYCTTKAALIFMTKMLAMDHAVDGIRANTISPGAILTERSSERYGGKAAAFKVHGPRHLLNRPGMVEEVAAAAAYLVSDDASFVTATDLLVDGGYVAFKGSIGPEGRPVM
jgi:NAD(P)-dependent dehydrogenase (short-subunit alcohol dehydrogenase family)